MVGDKTKKEKMNEVRILSDLADLYASALNLDQALQETIHLASRLTGADACFLYLYDPSGKNLILSASKTPHPKEVGQFSLKVGEGITGWVAKHHTPVSIPSGASRDPRFVGAFPEDRFEAFHSVPILIKNKVVGVINVQHKTSFKMPGRLLNLMAMVGRQIGGLIETARLYEETNRRAKALETLSAVSQTLAQDRYQDEIMQMIIQMTARMMGTNICSVMLLDEKKGELKIVASQSLDPEYLGKPHVKVSGSISGRAVLSRQPVYVKDVRTDPSYQFKDIAAKQTLVSLLAVPMMYKNKVVGILNSYKPEEYLFSKDETAFVQSVANQCAAAIENTRLLSEKLAAQEALESRKIIERAKGILMRTKNIGEQAAFREIQKQSMDRRKSMKEIGEAIVLANDLRG